MARGSSVGRCLPVLLSVLVTGCGDDAHIIATRDGTDAGTGGNGNGVGGNGGLSPSRTGADGSMPPAGGVTKPDAGAASACTPSATTETSCSGGIDEDCDGLVDCLDTDCEGQSCGGALTCISGGCLGKGPLPALPKLDNVTVKVRGDNAVVDFSAFPDARDYRIYVLPEEQAVSVGASGELSIRDAVYRCGGARPREDRANNAMKQFFDFSLAGTFDGYTRTESDATLGYVYTAPGPGRTAVYRVANPNVLGGYTWEYEVPPAKEYTGADYVAGAAARDGLLAKGWRDDGVAFYVDDAGTRPVYRKETDGHLVYFFTDGPEKTARDGIKDATFGERFKVLATQAAGSVPLYRIRYLWHDDHDNLAAGDIAKDEILHQGQIPLTSLVWPGLTAKTTLVVEALDAGCPFPGGYIGAMHAPSTSASNYPTLTLDEARLPTGELFVNGQYDTTNRPKPIARSYVDVEPGPRPDMDWYQGFDPGTDLGAAETLVSDGNGTRVFRTKQMSVEFFGSDANYSYGTVLGQFVAGSPGSVNVTALGANARLAPDRFLHVSMSVDVPSTARRYPQIWITDTPVGDPAVDPSGDLPVIRRLGPLPIDVGAPPGRYHTIVAQVFGGSPQLQLEFCDQRGWGVSQQCPRANIYGFHAGDDTVPRDTGWLPLPLAGEVTGADRLVKWDVYASTERVYLFMEDRPAGCAVLPKDRMPAGPVNVLFGFAGYHIDIDEFVTHDDSMHQYWKRFSVSHTERRMDDLGIKSGVAPPAWDESIMPCGTEYYGGS